MENSLKQRIIGAIVLVALGVIFLPSILKEKASNGIFESKIPQKPKVITDYKMDTYKIDELLAKEKTVSENIENKALESRLAEEQKPDNAIIIEQTEEGTEDNKEQADNSTDHAKNAEALTKESNLKGSASKYSSVKDKQIKAGAWIIQVASFSQAENSLKLVNKLKTSGHKAYKSEVIVNEKRVYRVFVGPFINKGQATTDITAINKVAGTKALLKVFNPIKH